MPQQSLIQKTLAANIAQLRRAAHLSQAALAARADTSRLTISNIERASHDPRLGTIEGIARALHVPVTDLLAPLPQQKAKRQ